MLEPNSSGSVVSDSNLKPTYRCRFVPSGWNQVRGPKHEDARPWLNRLALDELAQREPKCALKYCFVC